MITIHLEFFITIRQVTIRSNRRVKSGIGKQGKVFLLSCLYQNNKILILLQINIFSCLVFLSCRLCSMTVFSLGRSLNPKTPIMSLGIAMRWVFVWEKLLGLGPPCFQRLRKRRLKSTMGRSCGSLCNGLTLQEQRWIP